ncbi:hypothetical protein [Paenibacillus sp. PL2-23]
MNTQEAEPMFNEVSDADLEVIREVDAIGAEWTSPSGFFLS